MKNIIIALSTVTLLFVGCGSSGKSTATIAHGTYIDSAVDGVHYVCGSQTGVTGDIGKAGGFKYEVGKSCTFSLAGIKLSEVSGDKLEVNNAEVKVGDINVARFLQSLDVDGNPDNNGITISSKVVEVLANNNKTAIPQTKAEVDEIVGLLYNAGIGYNGNAKTKQEAELHMAGFSVTLTADKESIFEGQMIRLTANVQGNTEGITYEWIGLGETAQSFERDDFAAGTQVIVVKVTKGDITLSDSITIEVIDPNSFMVAISSSQTNFTTSEDVVLEANVTAASNSSATYTYVWKEGSTDLGENTGTLTKKFPAGEHTVTVEVTSNDETKSATFKFNVTDTDDFTITDKTITQNSKKLMWVDAKSTNTKQTCLAIHGDEYNSSRSEVDDSFQRAKTFCNALDFAGFTNWRTPTTEELSDYIIKTNEAGIKTKYDRECWQLLALVNQNADVTDGANYRAVTTRFMPTKWYPNIGTVRTHNYTKSASFVEKYNVGLRCVRNTDGSGGDIVGANISLTITGAKANYDLSETVNLIANVTGATPNSYSWKENGVELSNQATLSKSDFSKGEHNVTVSITTDEVNKSKSVTFDISDLSDFNITSFTANNDEVIIQKSTNLMWVNEHNAAKGKCAKIHNNDENHTTRYETEFATAKDFCKSSSFGNFAGKTGWRTPTKTELATFITSTINANILPAYDAKCKKLLALKDGATDEDANESYITVITRYGSNPGRESDLQPNIGLRCVRDNN
jgi:hypothetical protein